MKNQKGITLVALVITIIVLLILAGVSISLVVGDNGILTKATDSATKTDTAAVSSALQLSLATLQTEFSTDVMLNNYNAKFYNWFSLDNLNKQLKLNGYELNSTATGTPFSASADSGTAVTAAGTGTYADIEIKKANSTDSNVYKVRIMAVGNTSVTMGDVTLK
jgi:hypothetical protein